MLTFGQRIACCTNHRHGIGLTGLGRNIAPARHVAAHLLAETVNSRNIGDSGSAIRAGNGARSSHINAVRRLQRIQCIHSSRATGEIQCDRGGHFTAIVESHMSVQRVVGRCRSRSGICSNKRLCVIAVNFDRYVDRGSINDSNIKRTNNRLIAKFITFADLKCSMGVLAHGEAGANILVIKFQIPSSVAESRCNRRGITTCFNGVGISCSCRIGYVVSCAAIYSRGHVGNSVTGRFQLQNRFVLRRADCCCCERTDAQCKDHNESQQQGS